MAVLLSVLSAGSCARLAHCEMDKVRAEVLHYAQANQKLRPLERRWKRHVAEFDTKIYTNQKAGLDLLRLVLLPETQTLHDRLAALPVRSKLIRPHHRARLAAVRRLLQAYRGLLRAYPAEDFDAIRKGLREREEAWRALERAETEIRRLVQKYRSRR